MAARDRSDLGYNRDTLIESLSSAMSVNIFTNRYVLHPRHVNELVIRIADTFEAYRSSDDPTAVRDLGSSLAHVGLGVDSLMAAVGVLHKVCIDTDVINAFASVMVNGFVSSREGEILSSQEQLRRALSSALERQSRELLVKNQAIDSSINGILIADMGGHITYVNRSFLAMWGYESAEQLAGRRIGELWADDESRTIVEHFTQTGGWRGELPARKRDGVAFTVALSASYIRNSEGESLGIMAFFVDVTESKRLEIQMQQIQKMDDLGQLAGGIVHDFNNLLAAIGGYLQLVLLDTPNGGDIHRDLMQIKAAVDRGAGLTKQLGYFTRQATGKREVINLNDVALETYELLKHTFPRNIEIRLELGKSLWTIEADPNQMSQVIMNLCVNARDAIEGKNGTDSGGTLGRVSIETSNIELSERAAKQYIDVEPGKYVALRIIDTGAGIAPQVRKRLFVPFVTTKNAAGGTGLGLAVVYGIVRSHRGFIDLTSAQGFGTTFFVYLPMAGSSRQVDQDITQDEGLVQGEGTLLVVDDEAQVRDVIVRTLSLCGYQVLEASNGRRALECYRDHGDEIDLVILDMVMPEMSGQETLGHLRNLNPSVSALFMTGYTTDSHIVHLAERGDAQIIEKPVDLRLLTERVKSLVNVRTR